MDPLCQHKASPMSPPLGDFLTLLCSAALPSDMSDGVGAKRRLVLQRRRGAPSAPLGGTNRKQNFLQQASDVFRNDPL